mgnify:CR=1 FL=1
MSQTNKEIQQGPHSNTIRMRDCLKFNRCGAPICPLDPDWRLRAHLKGEPVCLYLREYVKSDARARFRGTTKAELFVAIGNAINEIRERYAPIKRALERAKKYGTKLKQPQRDNFVQEIRNVYEILTGARDV